MLCAVKLEKNDFEGYIPLSKIEKYQKWKQTFKLKQYTVKLNRIKLIWDDKRVKYINVSIKI